jgi:hypothetical protein
MHALSWSPPLLHGMHAIDIFMLLRGLTYPAVPHVHSSLQLCPARAGNNPDIIAAIEPILTKHKVQAYFAGHDHNLEHLRKKVTSTYTYDTIVTGEWITTLSPPMFLHGRLRACFLALVAAFAGQQRPTHQTCRGKQRFPTLCCCCVAGGGSSLSGGPKGTANSLKFLPANGALLCCAQKGDVHLHPPHIMRCCAFDMCLCW